MEQEKTASVGKTVYATDKSSSEPIINLREEKKLVWKCDRHVLPVISLLYMLAFVDRINIGNARIQGMEADLGMAEGGFGISLFVFFIPYVLFEVPSNIILKKIAPSTWLSSLMLCWGIITTCMGVTQSYGGLIACRVLLGLFEAGFVPGGFYLISMYYKRHEVQWRLSLWFCASILSGAFGGLFAYALVNLGYVTSLNGWRWIFIVEGLLTIVAAGLGKLFLVDWPEKAKFLTADERKLLLRRLEEDSHDAAMNRLDKKSTRRIWRDWKIYVGAVMYFGLVNTGYSTSYFTPTILQQLGWKAVTAQVMSIPIYVAAAAGSLLCAYISDKIKHRYSFAMLGIFIATIGYIILLAQEGLPISVRYFALYLVMIGGYISQPTVVGWVSNNMGGHYKRSVSSAVQVGFGNTGGIVACNIYINSQAPTYPLGYGVSLALLWVSGIACTIFLLGCWLENRKRDRGERDYRLNLPKEELDNLGDDHPRFRLTY